MSVRSFLSIDTPIIQAPMGLHTSPEMPAAVCRSGGLALMTVTPSDHLTFLTTRNGSPFTPAGFTNWFREVCNEAGLPKGTSAHGLRKAACRRLAEAGCSANVIAAVSGHRSLHEVQRYTAAADQLRMARAGIEAMPESFPATIKRTSTYKPE